MDNKATGYHCIILPHLYQGRHHSFTHVTPTLIGVSASSILSRR